MMKSQKAIFGLSMLFRLSMPCASLINGKMRIRTSSGFSRTERRPYSTPDASWHVFETNICKTKGSSMFLTPPSSRVPLLRLFSKADRALFENKALVEERKNLEAELKKAKKDLADAKKSHARELSEVRDAITKEKEAYLSDFLKSKAFMYGAIRAGDGLFKRACYLLYKDVAKGFPLLSEEIGLREISKEDSSPPLKYFSSCKWDRKIDRLVDPEGKPVIASFNRISIEPTGIHHPYPINLWPADVPKPPPPKSGPSGGDPSPSKGNSKKG